LTYRYSIPLEAFGLHRDRFCEYGEQRTLDEKTKLARTVEGLDGVSAAYLRSMDITPLRKALNDHGIGFSHFTVDLSRDRKWLTGSLTSPDPRVRIGAIEHIKDCMDGSKKIGSSLVNLCPMGDGYDYLFQAHYSKAWQWLIDSLKEACSYRSDVKISVEYKRKEPRTNIYVSDVGKALYVCGKVNAENLGVTVDFGHSLLARENPSESICLAAQENRLFSVHLNDNFGDWDWDMIPASVSLLQCLEALMWILKVGYEGWIFIDMFPFRLDPVKAATQSIENLRRLIRGIQEANLDMIEEKMRQQDYLDALKMMLEKA